MQKSASIEPRTSPLKFGKSSTARSIVEVDQTQAGSLAIVEKPGKSTAFSIDVKFVNVKSRQSIEGLLGDAADDRSAPGLLSFANYAACVLQRA